MRKPLENIALIGMPAVGKSTAGVLLAKVSWRDFVDTDVLIQSREGQSLERLLLQHGSAGFCAIEERHVLDLEPRRCVIATGGSVVYSEPAMRRLRAVATVAHIRLSLESLTRRLSDLRTRGVVMRKAADLAALYEERMPLYERYADIEVDAEGLDHEELVSALLRAERDAV